MKMNSLSLTLFVALSIITSGSVALKCITCSGDGASCRNQNGSISQPCQRLPPNEEGICGRANFKVNDTNKVMERCVLKKFCIGTIDCLKDGFELGKLYPGASECVVSCCEGDDCNPKPPLHCYQCKGKGKTCSDTSISCGYGDDRCLRINFKVNGNLMVDERCYQSSRCTNATEICDSVKKEYTSASDCTPTCCQENHCNDKINKASATLKPGATIALLLVMLTLGTQE